MTSAPLDSATIHLLLDRARAARRHAYVPYSGYTVGAALLTADGEVVTGCNVENVSYGLANCAERTAVFKAVSEGKTAFRAVAVVGLRDDQPCTPCGACRQVMFEFAPELAVVTVGADGAPRVVSLADLLPEAFDRRNLPEKGGAS